MRKAGGKCSNRGDTHSTAFEIIPPPHTYFIPLPHCVSILSLLQFPSELSLGVDELFTEALVLLVRLAELFLDLRGEGGVFQFQGLVQGLEFH